MTDMKLGGAFAPPDRTAGIAPPPPRTVPDPAPQQQWAAPQQPVQQPVQQPAAGSAVPAAGGPVDARFAGDAPQRLSPDTAVVYLTQDVHARLKRYVEAARRRPAVRDAAGRVLPRPSFTSVVLEAVQAEHARLEQIVGPAEVPATSLFTPRRPQRRVLAGLQVQVTLTPGRDNVEVLDGLATGCDVSRSALVDAVLDVWLPQSRRKPGKVGILDADAATS
jgi:hypothetical protein